jgi:hypothetical protein
MKYMDIKEYYSLNHSLFYYHKLGIDTIENMIPYERDIYVQLTLQAEEAKKAEQ